MPPPADREVVREVTVKPEVARATPEEQDISFPPGEVVYIEVVIPDGAAGLSGYQLTNSGQQALPYNTGAFFVGNDEVIRREVTGYNNSGRWGFRAYNEGHNEHTYQIRFSIREIQAATPTEAPSTPLSVTGAGQVAIEGPETAPGEPASEPGQPLPEGVPGEEPPTAPGEPPTPTPPPEETPPVAPPPEGAEEPPPAEPPPVFGPGEAESEPEPPGLPPPGEVAAEVEGEGETGTAGHGAPSGAKGKGHGKKPGTTTRTRTVTKVVHYPAGGWLPPGARFTRERTDQGQDLITNWRGPVIAPGDGEVIHNLSDKAFPVGFGPHYAVVRITSGPFSGHDWYIGHATSAVDNGHKFRAGAVLAHADQGKREGGGWVEIGEAPGGYPGPMGNGANFAHLFVTVTRRESHKVVEHIKVKGTHPKRKAGKPGAKVRAKHPPAKRTGSGRKRAAAPGHGRAPVGPHHEKAPSHPSPRRAAPSRPPSAPHPGHPAPTARKASAPRTPARAPAPPPPRRAAAPARPAPKRRK